LVVARRNDLHLHALDHHNLHRTAVVPHRTAAVHHIYRCTEDDLGLHYNCRKGGDHLFHDPGGQEDHRVLLMEVETYQAATDQICPGTLCSCPCHQV
jgi:hypothetical protein